MVLIYLFFFLVLLISFLYHIALKTEFIFDTNTDHMILSLLWIYPFLKANVEMHNKAPLLTVFIFNKKVFEKDLKTKSKKAKQVKPSLELQLVQSAFVEEINITANYGFQNKFITGIMCGAVTHFSQLFRLNEFYHNPDFFAIDDYIYVRITAEVMLLSTLKQLFRRRFLLNKNNI